MQASRKSTSKVDSRLPKKHIAAATAVAFCLVGVMSLLPSKNVQAKRNVIALDLPADAPALSQAASPAPSTPDKSNNDSAPKTLNWQETTIASGDNLTTAFKRLGLNASDVYRVANTSTERKPLRRLRPGEHIAICLNEEGLLAQVKYTRSTLEHYLYERGESGFTGKKIVLQPDLLPTYKTAIINNSLSLDANRVGLSQAKIMELANIFGWDIDFALDIRNGDAFSVLYDEKFLNGEKVGTGDILAATFSNHGTTYSAVRYIEQDGSINYYTPDGKPMRKAFLRAPLDFTRISSNFSLRRKHPVHKRIKAHRGVDYAAPRGTPVYAAGDGKIIASGYSKANGNYVFIQHGGKYVTKYLHLTKRLTRKGKHVSQGKTIGTVGSTGYATGPHLHYEFLVNGVHRNPRTVKLPDAKTIAKNQRGEFYAQTTPLLNQLSQHDGLLLAQADLHD
ncbi:MAG: peptidoglycan DD-metalloendopeptidase family protein [Gammaproteobacteria bacterium]|nr:peptidoglycan DD-metalloendopeptidase family protein [Gammaproteobacteria bacterium]MBQ0840956.1 peptidoglycan DD-metalloendopeptidase family protein [Gammaproteobacteria bacterium]